MYKTRFFENPVKKQITKVMSIFQYLCIIERVSVTSYPSILTDGSYPSVNSMVISICLPLHLYPD